MDIYQERKLRFRGGETFRVGSLSREAKDSFCEKVNSPGGKSNRDHQIGRKGEDQVLI